MKAKDKKRLILGLAVMLVAALVVGMTIAYFYDTDEAVNVFTVGDLDIELEEEEWDDDHEEDPEITEDMVPGDTVVKDPVISSKKGSVDSYMRVVLTLLDEDGVAITNPARITKILSVLYHDVSGEITKGTPYSLANIAAWNDVVQWYNTADFTLDAARSSGAKFVLNYNSVFEAEDAVALFTNVVIPTDWTQTDTRLLGNFSIEIKAEAIQVEHFATQADAYTALDAELAKLP